MNYDNLSANFYNSLISHEPKNKSVLSLYFSFMFEQNYSLGFNMPNIICWNNISAQAPFSYTLSNFNFFCLIHTKKGKAKLTYCQKDYALTSDTIAFIDCNVMHTLTSLTPKWEYTIAFLPYTNIELYYKNCCPDNRCVFYSNFYSDFLTIWTNIMDNMSDTELNCVMREKLLVDFFTELYLLRLKENSDVHRMPTYLKDLKNCFDNDYDEPFSLEESANKYHINKYRLCREFSAYFGNTPLQYLNNIRIDQAKDLLINTDEKISTIGQMVGFENTNHFIRLFKSKTGVTPLIYRKMTPVITNM